MSVLLDPSVPRQSLAPSDPQQAELPPLSRPRTRPLSEWGVAGRRARGRQGRKEAGEGAGWLGGAGQGAWLQGEVN